jgi:hypothetical protein
LLFLARIEGWGPSFSIRVIDVGCSTKSALIPKTTQKKKREKKINQNEGARVGGIGYRLDEN